MMIFIYLFYLIKIDDRRIRGPLILSDVQKETQIYTMHKRTKRKNKQTNKEEMKHRNNTGCRMWRVDNVEERSVQRAYGRSKLVRQRQLHVLCMEPTRQHQTYVHRRNHPWAPRLFPVFKINESNKIVFALSDFVVTFLWRFSVRILRVISDNNAVGKYALSNVRV